VWSSALEVAVPSHRGWYFLHFCPRSKGVFDAFEAAVGFFVPANSFPMLIPRVTLSAFASPFSKVINGTGKSLVREGNSAVILLLSCALSRCRCVSF